ncbi:MAG: sirohydrochlorin cobaltochelatase [Oscillospiraceae bacterium]|nr:sirohydrochlorin cobaltochelatase [Oscillospiraceae bacterium]
MKKTLALILAAVLLFSLLAACAKQETPAPSAEPSESAAPAQSTEPSAAPSESAPAPAEEEEDEENYDTGDASLDNVRNEDGIGPNELLVVSFGTSFNDSRRLTIGGIEAAVEAAFPNWSVRRGFTSQIIIDHVKSRDNVAIDNLEEALDRAVANGVQTLVVQPTHLMSGFEYTDVQDTVAKYADSFEEVVLGTPLLTSDEDFDRVADIIVEATKQYDDGKTAICFMGHGTEAASNPVYAKMQQILAGKGMANYFIGTVEAEPSLEDVLAAVKAGSYEKVVLEPLMIVAGDHANNDMAGDEEDSWKSAFEAEGYKVECILRGLGELEGIQQLIVEHTQAAMAGLEENYDTGDAMLDDTRNADGIGEDELLVVSFGTSFNDSRRQTIGAIEAAEEAAFPEWSVRRGFTSQIIIDHVKKRDNVTIDNLEEALDRAVANGVKRIVLQPTHLMSGFEYTDVQDTVAKYADSFEKIAIGTPLLTTDDDFARVADVIVEATREYDDGKTAICFMGHGTEADSNPVYAKMQQILADKGLANYFIGTVEAEPSLEDVLAMVKAGEYTRVVLEPLMIVAGDHANNDMAGDEEDSWKSVFEAEGYEVECILRGLGELEGIRQLIVEHTQAAIDQVA